MEKKKSKWTILKEAWKDPKKHAIICLILYGIFFLFIFLWIEISNMIYKSKSNDEENIDVLYNYKNMNNYEYNYTINNNGNIYLVDGKVYKEKEQLELKNTKESVYIENNEVEFDETYLNIENKINIYLDEITPDKIYSILKSIECTLEDNKDICSTDTNTINQIFINKYEDNKTVEISVYKNSYNINKIEINVKELNNSIEIEYSNIGDVTDFNYEE